MLRSSSKSLRLLRSFTIAPQFRKMTTIPKTQKAIVFHETNPDKNDYSVLKYEDIAVPQIADDEILIKNKYSGVNFIEQYFRIGLYPAQTPYILGREAVGSIVAKGPKVEGDFEVGDLVGYTSVATFAQYSKLKPPLKIFKLPKDSSEETLQLYAALLIQGLTALTFITEAYYVKKGDNILVYAAAGGVGQNLIQLIKLRGAHVIAVVSTDAKAEIVKKLGADHVVNSTTEDVAARVLEITNGKGVEASFDSVGKDTFETTLKSLARKGSFVSFGNSSGPAPPVVISRDLAPKNLKILRPSVFNYLVTLEEWQHYSKELRDLVSSGKIKVDISKIYDLKDYAEAAKALEGRKTTGKLVLRIPE